MTHQPAISISISFLSPFNRAGGRTSNVRFKIETMLRVTIGIAAAFLVGCSTSSTTQSSKSDELVVSITEDNEAGQTPVTTVFLIDKGWLHATPIPHHLGQPFPPIRKYTILNGQLSAAGRPLTAATEILTQTTVGGDDFVVLRDEHNSRVGPLNLLLYLGSHPVQVSKIAIVRVASGRLLARRELTSKEASYHWSATIYK